jgi:two-component system phosphate regulon sensor histidine kinase PhoR
MKETKRLLYPILIFICSIVALGLSLSLYIYWYVEVSSRLQTVIRRFGLDRGQFLALETWVVIVILSILVGLILAGIFIIFVYHLKTNQLYRLQRNFINSFTHELKTPVTSIKLYLETFRRYELARDNQLKYIDYMLIDIARLTDNINRVLNVARIESGGYEATLVTLDLAEVVRAFVDRNRHLFGNSLIKINTPDGPPLNHAVDRALFEILLMNLITNAIRYNDSERPEITISFTRLAKGVRIDFADNGRGIDRHEFKKIFKKFYQVRGEEKPGAGSGLGLYLVDKIAKIHNGRVVVESEGPGRGTTFSLALPAAGRQ